VGGSGVVYFDTHATLEIQNDRQRTRIWRRQFRGKEGNEGVLLIVAHLRHSIRNSTATLVEVKVGHVGVGAMIFCAGFGFSIAIEDYDTAQNAILGPVPNNVTNLSGVNVVGDIARVVENRRGSRRRWNHVSIVVFFGRHDPENHAIHVSCMQSEVHIEYSGSQLVDSDGD
jgi:hypothetical protein